MPHSDPDPKMIETVPGEFYRKGRKYLNIIIIGAGIGGLALAGTLGHSGHKVIVLEAAPEIGEVGAGIYAAPNLTRLLGRWGFDDILGQHTDPLSRIDLRRWENGEKLGAATLMPEISRRHGAPQYVVHRVDLHRALMQDAQKVADLRVNSAVHSIDFELTTVTLQDGTVMKGDIIVGADGMKSTCRRLMYKELNLVDKVRPTGDAAFRALIPLENVKDEALREFVTLPVATRWMGPDRHVQGYPIRHGALYNMVLVHPDTGISEESWTVPASKEEILEHFGRWDTERLRKIIDLMPNENIIKWRLCEHDALPTWVIGNVALLGDACHPMLPYVGQGSAQAVEDASVLVLALNQLSQLSDAPTILKAYELARKARVEQVVRTSGITRAVLHLPDGLSQQERDQKFRDVVKGGENPDLLGDHKSQAALWGFDPEKDFQERFNDLFNEAQSNSSGLEKQFEVLRGESIRYPL